MWAGGHLTVVPSAAPGELPMPSFYTFGESGLDVDVSGYTLTGILIVYAFTELADGEFFVTSKGVVKQGE